MLDLHGGAYVRRLIVKVSRDFRRALGTHRSVSPHLQTEFQGGTPAFADAKGSGRHLVCVGHRLPMEGDAQAVRIGQRDPRLLPRVGRIRRVPAVVGIRFGRIRRVKRDRLEVAEYGRGDDQIAAGWGKKPAKTRPIAASWA